MIFDDSVLEHAIGCLEEGRLNKAVRLCNKVTSSFPDVPYGHAVDALISWKMKKEDVALTKALKAKSLLKDKNNSRFIGERTLSTLKKVFKELGHSEHILECYELACVACPMNKELLFNLFICYVQQYNFVKQEKIAFQLYDITKEEKFLFWAACSSQLEVLFRNQEKEVLGTAERLIKDHIVSYGLIVYVSLLKRQSKYSEALEILSGDLANKIDYGHLLVLRGELLASKGYYVAAADEFEKALKLCPKDLKCFLHYLRCLLEDFVDPPKFVDSKNLKLTDEQFDSRIRRASKFIKQLLTQGSDAHGLRVLSVAKIEIRKTKIIYGKSCAGKLVYDLCKYIFKYGSLVLGISSDIEPFLAFLDGWGLRHIVWERAHHRCMSDSPTPFSPLQRFVSMGLFKSYIGDIFSCPQIDMDIDALYENNAVILVNLYCKRLERGCFDHIEETVFLEDVLSMACHMLVQFFWRTRNMGYLLESILILEFGFSIKCHTTQYKFLLLHLYSYWGCLPVAYQWYKSLDLNRNLMEGFLHHILPEMLVSPLWSDLNDLLTKYLIFMDEEINRYHDLAICPYHEGHYSKVLEVMQLKEQREMSSQYLVAKIESAILQLKQQANSVSEAKKILKSLDNGKVLSELYYKIRKRSPAFNEALELRPWWTPTPYKNYLLGSFEKVLRPEFLMEETRESVLCAIKKRCLVPRMIHLSLEFASSLTTNHSEFKRLLDQYARVLNHSFEEAVKLVCAVSSGENSFEDTSLNIVDWMNFAVFLNAWKLRRSEKTETKNTWKVVNTLFKTYIGKKLESLKSSMPCPGNDLPVLVQLVTEPFTWHRLIIQAFCTRGSSGTKMYKMQKNNMETDVEFVGTVYDVIQDVIAWLTKEIKKSNETMKSNKTKSESILSSLRHSEEGYEPGRVLTVLKTTVLSANTEILGEEIFNSLKSWSAEGVVDKLVAAQGTVLSKLRKICKHNAKLLYKHKRSKS